MKKQLIVLTMIIFACLAIESMEKPTRTVETTYLFKPHDIFDAMDNNQWNEVKSILEVFPDESLKQRAGEASYTPLMHALQKGDMTSFLYILGTSLKRAHPDLDAQDANGNTALHYAILKAKESAGDGHDWLLTAIYSLVKYGANPRLSNKAGITPQAMATEAIAKKIAEAEQQKSKRGG